MPTAPQQEGHESQIQKHIQETIKCAFAATRRAPQGRWGRRLSAREVDGVGGALEGLALCQAGNSVSFPPRWCQETGS